MTRLQYKAEMAHWKQFLQTEPLVVIKKFSQKN